MSKDIAAWAGVLLIEAAVLTWFGTASALACAIPLLVYAFGDKPEISRILRKLRLTTRRAVVLAIAVAIAVIALDTWQHRYEPILLKRLITLVEHDPGNWRNYVTGERSIRLGESTHLISTVGTIQRFNPRLGLLRACLKCRITYTITGKTETSGVLPIDRTFYWDVLEATR